MYETEYLRDRPYILETAKYVVECIDMYETGIVCTDWVVCECLDK